MEEWNWQQREAVRLRAHCQHFSRLGWALFAQMGLGLGLQLVVVLAVQFLRPELLYSMAFLWGLSAVTTYGAGCVAFCIIIRTAAPKPVQTRRSLGPVRLFQVYCIAGAALYLSNFLTLTLLGVIGMLKGSPVENPVESMSDLPVILNLLLSCVIAPVLEELMFRGLLLSRLRPYGDKFAIVASALCFGLFHGNLSQFFYAFSTGLVFAYVVVKTGCLWQTMLLHALINFTSAGLIPILERFGETGAVVLSTFVIALILLGITFFLALRREIHLEDDPAAIGVEHPWPLLVQSPGMAVFCLLVLCSMAAQLLV